MKKITGFPTKNNNQIKYLSLVMASFLLLVTAYSQERKLVYDVVKNGNIIGKIIFSESIKDEKKLLNLTSDVKTRFIFSFTDHAAETASFVDGIMVYSSFYQKQNGSEKARKITIASGQFYNLIDNGVSTLIACNPIRYNMLLLYTNIPEKITKVYSDNYQKLLDIEKVESNKYKLRLPDGNSNYYTYNNNVCIRVDIERTFFSVQFVLREE